MPKYTSDSPHWEVWFALENEEQWCLDVHHHHTNPPPPLVVEPEEEAAYQAALAATMETPIEDERLKAKADYQARLAEALALSAVGDCVVPPSLNPPDA